MNYHWTDFLFDNFGKIILGFLFLMGFMLGQAMKQQSELMAECMDDGHKRYECVSMLRRNSSTTVAPVIVPIR